MPGVPQFIYDSSWWWLFAFLTGVVFFRTQGTYWIARWARAGTETLADKNTADARPTRRTRLAAALSGPGTEKARIFLERWGFIGIPVSFLTIGFQTLVHASAGYTRMRFDLYTLAMIPGCFAWAAVYTAIGLSLWEVWLRSPWLLALVIVALVALAFGLNRWRRKATERRTAASESPPEA